MFRTALSFSVMADEKEKRLTLEIPADLHEAFLRKCFNAKPRVTMRERIIGFIAKETGLPMPKLVDRRKWTREQREKYDAGK